MSATKTIVTALIALTCQAIKLPIANEVPVLVQVTAKAAAESKSCQSKVCRIIERAKRLAKKAGKKHHHGKKHTKRHGRKAGKKHHHGKKHAKRHGRKAARKHRHGKSKGSKKGGKLVQVAASGRMQALPVPEFILKLEREKQARRVADYNAFKANKAKLIAKIAQAHQMAQTKTRMYGMTKEQMELYSQAMQNYAAQAAAEAAREKAARVRAAPVVAAARAPAPTASGGMYGNAYHDAMQKAAREKAGAMQMAQTNSSAMTKEKIWKGLRYAMCKKFNIRC